ncbi:hypothetical protein PFISCL1PPCAC_21072, partial [Pristionchus fissidentatus]
RSVKAMYLHLRNTHATTPSRSHLLTICSYSMHLHKLQKSSLIKSGVHLLCSCGAMINGSTTASKHMKICAEREFAVEKS